MEASSVCSGCLDGGLRYIATGRFDGGIALHDTQRTAQQTLGGFTRTVFPLLGAVKGSRKSAHKHETTTIQFYPIDAGLLTTSSYRDRVLKVWDPNTLTLVDQVSLDPGGGVVGSPQQQHCLTLHHDMAHHHPVTAVACADGDVRLCDLRTGSSCQRLSGHAAHSGSDRSSSSHGFPGDAQRYGNNSSATRRCATGNGGEPRSYNSKGGTYNSGADVSSISAATRVLWHPVQENLLSAGYRDGSIHLWDIRASKSYVGSLAAGSSCYTPASKHGLMTRPRAHGAAVTGLRYTGDGAVLATHCRNVVKLWDAYDGRDLGVHYNLDGYSDTESTPSYMNHVSDIRLSTKVKLLLICRGCEVLFLNLYTGELLAKFKGHMLPLLGCLWDDKQHRVFTYGKDNNFVEWEFKRTEPTQTQHRKIDIRMLVEMRDRREREQQRRGISMLGVERNESERDVTVEDNIQVQNWTNNNSGRNNEINIVDRVNEVSGVGMNSCSNSSNNIRVASSSETVTRVLGSNSTSSSGRHKKDDSRFKKGSERSNNDGKKDRRKSEVKRKDNSETQSKSRKGESSHKSKKESDRKSTESRKSKQNDSDSKSKKESDRKSTESRKSKQNHSDSKCNKESDRKSTESRKSKQNDSDSKCNKESDKQRGECSIRKKERDRKSGDCYSRHQKSGSSSSKSDGTCGGSTNIISRTKHNNDRSNGEDQHVFRESCSENHKQDSKISDGIGFSNTEYKNVKRTSIKQCNKIDVVGGSTISSGLVVVQGASKSGDTVETSVTTTVPVCAPGTGVQVSVNARDVVNSSGDVGMPDEWSSDEG